VGIRSILSKPLAHFLHRKNNGWINHADQAQERIFHTLIETAKATEFGRRHSFEKIHSYEDYKKNVPVREYEGIKEYVDLILEGRQNILWPGKPLYLAKTSGTTSGSKYIPITKESIPNHINSTRDALMDYIVETGKSQFLDKKLIFLSGSPVLDKKAGIHVGRLSGIVNHHVPAILRSNQMPSYETNCIEDWETKVDRIVEETFNQDMSLISGIPSWVQMYFEKLKQKSGGKSIQEIFPNFSLFIYGGVNYEPYRNKFERYIGGKVDSMELFPASEGFFAYQNQQDDKGLLLMANSGIFYEFIPADEYFNENPTRLNLSQVKTGVNYALVVSSNAGLWSYSIGDMVKFTSVKPYKLIVAGRIKHYTSAFGEHVIAEEVEAAMHIALSKFGGEVSEFHVAPMVNPKEGLPYHEWMVEFSSKPQDMEGFTRFLDQTLQTKNIYYKDLIQGHVLQQLVITPVSHEAFIAYMKSEGKLGGQNKLPRLANDRKIADKLSQG
jgi:hypothetical protein